MPSPAQETSYDRIPYESLPFPHTHPDRLATAARLFGMDPASPDKARVLEIGCASGGNLIPMALAAPEGRFVGVDLSARQVARGRELIGRLGLGNIELNRADLRDLDAGWGRFDYVIAHGLYSWIPAEARERLLGAYATLLAPSGVGFISYNVFPGWHLRTQIRDMVMYHARHFPIEEQLGQAKAFLNFLADNTPAEGDPYGAFLRQMRDFWATQDDSYLFHEFLEEVNAPLYFHEFAAQLPVHGLQYLAESAVVMNLTMRFPPGVRDTLNRLGRDLVRREQYMDFLVNRPFRESLVVGEGVRLDRRLSWERVADFYLCAQALPVDGDVDWRLEQAVEFRSPNGGGLRVRHPLTKKVLTLLTERWPLGGRLDELLAVAAGALRAQGVDPHPPGVGAEPAAAVAADLLLALALGVVEFRILPPPCVAAAGERPKVSPYAVLEAEWRGRVTSLRHEIVNVTPLVRSLLPLLDGTHDRSALVRAWMKAAQAGRLPLPPEAGKAKGAEAVAGVLGTKLDAILADLAKVGLLLA